MAQWPFQPCRTGPEDDGEDGKPDRSQEEQGLIHGHIPALRSESTMLGAQGCMRSSVTEGKDLWQGARIGFPGNISLERAHGFAWGPWTAVRLPFRRYRPMCRLSHPGVKAELLHLIFGPLGGRWIGQASHAVWQVQVGCGFCGLKLDPNASVPFQVAIAPSIVRHQRLEPSNG